MSNPPHSYFESVLDHLRDMGEIWKSAPTQARRDMMQKHIASELTELGFIMRKGVDTLRRKP